MTIERIADIEHRHLRKELWEGKTFYTGHIMIDMLYLVEEIRKLQSELSVLKAIGAKINERY